MEQAEKDRQLVKRFQKGDMLAFSQFIQCYQDRLYRIALVKLHVKSQADDAVQEAFLRALKGLSHFRFGAKPFTWLYRTLHNVCLELNRKHSCNLGNEEGRQESVDVNSSIETELDNRGKAQRVKALVNLLPEKQKEVVLLRIFEELSVRQTAEILGCREGTVKANLFKAMVNLKMSPAMEKLRGDYE